METISQLHAPLKCSILFCFYFWSTLWNFFPRRITSKYDSIFETGAPVQNRRSYTYLQFSIRYTYSYIFHRFTTKHIYNTFKTQRVAPAIRHMCVVQKYYDCNVLLLLLSLLKKYAVPAAARHAIITFVEPY